MKSSKDLISWIKKQGVVRADGISNDSEGSNDGYKVVEIWVAFGAGADDLHNVDVYFEDDLDDDDSTVLVLETELPLMEYDKKWIAELQNPFLQRYAVISCGCIMMK